MKLQYWWEVLCVIMLAAVLGAGAADIIPRRAPRPSFQVIAVREQRANLSRESDNQIEKVYHLEIREGAGVWRIIVDRNNRVIGEWFVKDRS